MKKIIKAYGKTLVISFNKEDSKVNPMIKEGNIADLTDMVITDNKKDERRFKKEK